MVTLNTTEELRGRLLTVQQQQFEMAAWDGENHSGYEPLDDKVLVLVDTHVAKTAGGIIVPDATAERQTLAAEHGTVVALGPAAFKWNDDGTRLFDGRKPVPGDRVYVERYAGQLLNGLDGRQYRLMSQKCIGAIAVAQKAPSAKKRKAMAS